MKTSVFTAAFVAMSLIAIAETPAAKDSITLFDGKSLADWEKVDIGGSGEITVEAGEMIINQGDSVTGCVYKKLKDLPLQNYEISLQAMRVAGSDFFCGLTFPVGDPKTFLTLVCGGWGGGVTGISSIDGMDASENNTATVQRYADNKWYQIKVRVTPKDIKVWLDDKEIIDVEIEGHKLGLRPGPIESYAGLSFTTYQTTAAIKDVKITKLK